MTYIEVVLSGIVYKFPHEPAVATFAKQYAEDQSARGLKGK
jgi:hypothetical protein